MLDFCAIAAVPAAFVVATQLIQPAASAATVSDSNASTGLKLTTSVSNWPITPDPGSSAFVKFTLKVRNSSGEPVNRATVTMSNAKSGARFYTNTQGVLTLVERVTVKPGSNGGSASITAHVIAKNEATGSITQVLYRASMQAYCSFDGKPGPDLSLLDNMLPARLGAIQTLIENLGPLFNKYHTTAAGYKIAVPKSSNIYAQTVQITHGKSTSYSGTGYSRKPILKAGSLWDQIQDGCTSVSGGGLA